MLIQFHSAARNDVVNVRMIDRRVTPPSMKHTEEPKLASFQTLGCRSHIANALTAGIEQASVAVTLVNAQHQANLPGHRESDQEVMNRHQLGSLRFNPSLRPLVTAVRAVPIATRTSDPVIASAAAALVVNTTQCTGATTSDRAKNFVFGDRDRIGVLLQVCRCELAKSLRNRGHLRERVYSPLPGSLPNSFSISSRALASAVSVRCR